MSRTSIPDQTRRLMQQCMVLFVISLLVLAVFQSSALVTLSYDLPPSAITETVIQAAEKWNGAMQVIGADDFSRTVSERLEEWRSVKFS